MEREELINEVIALDDLLSQIHTGVGISNGKIKYIKTLSNIELLEYKYELENELHHQ